jgi:twitching motility protein PilT
MTLVPSMLRAIVDVDGEALVIRAGEKPYVVAPAGHVDLTNRPLTMDALKGIVAQLLPDDVARALDEFGAVQHEIVSPPDFPGESFTVVAARGGDDMWVEIRRRRVDQTGAAEVSPEPAAQRLAIAATVRRGAEAANLRRQTATPQRSSAAPPKRPAPQMMPESPTVVLPDVPVPPQREPADPLAVPPSDVVFPMARSPVRLEGASRGGASASRLGRLLQTAAARGASMLYLSSDAQPSVRVDGDVQVLTGEPVLGAHEIESLLMTIVPDRRHESLRNDWATESIAEVEGVGRVRCMTFRDQRGPGGVFRIMPARAASAAELGLSREVESLALEPEGLVLVAGPRLSGKRTTISALVDVTNRKRRGHVITVEEEIRVVHGAGTSIVSQREVRGSADDIERVTRAALREDPDVLVIESIVTAPLVDLALEAASRRLVIAGLPARDAVSAIGGLVNLYPVDERRQVQPALAERLRGVVAQSLVRKIGGGRVVAREILLRTPAVAAAITEGRTSQLPMAIDAGRRLGMQRLNDSLATLVQSAAVDVKEAYRHAVDRAGFIVLLEQMGIDTKAL